MVPGTLGRWRSTWCPGTLGRWRSTWCPGTLGRWRSTIGRCKIREYPIMHIFEHPVFIILLSRCTSMKCQSKGGF